MGNENRYVTRNNLINDLVLALFSGETENATMIECVLAEYDYEMSQTVCKEWLYDEIASIIHKSTKSVYNKLSGDTDFTRGEIESLYKYFDGNASYDNIYRYIRHIRGLINNEY